MGWKSKKLAELCDVFSDGDWIETKMQSNSGIRLIQTGNIGEGIFKNRLDKSRYISEITLKEQRCTEIFEGDCLISRLPEPVGRACILPSTEHRMITAVDCTILRFKSDQISPQYFNYYSQSAQYLSKVDSLTSGATRKRISRKNLGLVEVPFPDLKEQEKIVCILDKALDAISNAREVAEKNIKNARELFESYLHQAYSDNECDEVLLGDIVDVLTDYHANGSYKILKQHVELKEKEDYAWMVRSTDFEKQFKNDKRYIAKSAYDYLKKTPLFGGEIIMSKIGNAGKVYLMPKVDRPCSLAMNLFLIRLNPKVAHNEYVFRYLNSVSGKAQIQPLLNGAATQTITKYSVRSLKIRLPSISEQERVVNNLNELQKEVDLLQQIYEQKLDAIDELKKSILKKAFSGELTSCKGVAA